LDQPSEGQSADRPAESAEQPADASKEQPGEDKSGDDDSSDDWRTWSGRSVNP